MFAEGEVDQIGEFLLDVCERYFLEGEYVLDGSGQEVQQVLHYFLVGCLPLFCLLQGG